MEILDTINIFFPSFFSQHPYLFWILFGFFVLIFLVPVIFYVGKLFSFIVSLSHEKHDYEADSFKICEKNNNDEYIIEFNLSIKDQKDIILSKEVIIKGLTLAEVSKTHGRLIEREVKAGIVEASRTLKINKLNKIKIEVKADNMIFFWFISITLRPHNKSCQNIKIYLINIVDRTPVNGLVFKKEFKKFKKSLDVYTTEYIKKKRKEDLKFS